MRLFLLAISLTLLLPSTAQEIRMGISYGVNVYQSTKLDLPSLTPENSYHTYLVAPDKNYLLEKNSFVSGYFLGASFNFGWRKFGLNISPQFYFQRTVLRFDYPFEVFRVWGKRALRIPFYFTYKFFKKERSIFLLAGFTVNKETNWDFQSPDPGFYFGPEPIYQNTINTGDGHFENYLYQNNPYVNFSVGIGRNFRRWNTILRYHTKAGGGNIPVQTSQIELGFNILFLSSKDFTQKHFLYVE